MKPIWKILIAAVVLIAIVVALFVVPHYRAKAALDAYRRQLITKGEKLTFAELTPILPAEATDGGAELLAALGMTSSFTNSPPMMKWLAPGRALAGWSETNSPTENLTNCWPEFAEVVKRHPEIIQQVATALQRAGVGYHVQYQQGFSALLPHLAPLRRGSVWLAGSTSLALHEHDQPAAWIALSQETGLLRKYASEPLMISQIVHAVMVQTGIAVTWDALQYPGWSEAQLAQLQTDWESLGLLGHGTSALSMERAMQELAFKQMRDSYKIYIAEDDNPSSSFDSFDQVLVNPQQGVPGFFGKVPRYWMWRWWGSYDEELYLSQLMQAALETMRSVQNGAAFVPALEGFHLQVEGLQKIHPGAKQRFAFANRLERVVSSYLRRIGETEMARQMMVTAVALERYRRQHGNYPEQLGELTPDFLKKAPIDFMDGKPLRYRRNNDGTFLMYSVGLDGKDDGGDGTLPDPGGLRPNIWTRMRDAVWPMPATPEEVKNYEAGMLQKVLQRQLPLKPVFPKRPPAPPGTNSTSK